MPKDPYLYTNSETLINLFNERDDKILKEIEANYTTFRLRQLYEHPIKSSFNFEHLCTIHKFIFQDLYSWAGQIRTINIEKEEPVLGGISIEYSDFKDIKKEAEKILIKIKDISWDKISIEEKAMEFSRNFAFF